MKILNPEIDLDRFQRAFQAAAEKALFLDYDGTLAPFQVEPAKAEPYPGVREVLNKLLERPDIRLVIISGRWTRDLLPLLRLDRQPEIWGCHGLERLQAEGTYQVGRVDRERLAGLAEAERFLAAKALDGQCEKKPGCLALHWRGRDKEEQDKIRDMVKPEWARMAAIWKLNLQEFDGGLELRLPGINKGSAVRTVLAEMSPHTVAAYLGDDLTDEEGFRAVKAKGIGVLVRKELRPTNADLWLRPPQELLLFLHECLSENRD